MAGVWKRDGTIAVTKGSKKVVGTGTTFADPKNAAAKGHLLVMVTGTAVDLYEVDYSESNSVFYLVEAFRGDTGTGKAYAIDTSRTDSIPEFARRLNATLGAYQQQSDAFQALLTSDAATIEVTAPDGTKHTMIPWKRVTSEGEGQAARAKVEADKAAASAASAAAAALAARLPTPDVSIPFSTDGRMTHGKGAPVLVGTIPVAQLVNYERLGSQTMIDKSGRLLTVPAGEMAIERQGLAIFDQSTNVWAPSTNWAAGANALTPWVHAAPDAEGWIAVTVAGDPAQVEGSYKSQPVGTANVPFTFSLDVLKTAGLSFRIRTYNTSSNAVDVLIDEATVTGAGASDVIDLGRYWRVEMTRTFSGATGTFRIYPAGSTKGSSGTATYRRCQLEQKQFATPYIENATSAQTTRPATTRCDIPWPGNMQPLTDWQELTIAFEFDTAGVPASPASHTIFTQGGGVAQHLMARLEPNSRLRFYRSADPTHQPTIVTRRRYKMCYRINRNACDLFIDGVRVDGGITAAPVASGFYDILRFGCSVAPDRCLNGHLRNINIWNSPLTDAQCVAASS